MRRRADGVEPKCAHIPSIAQIAQDRICQLSLRKNRAVNFEAWLGRQNVYSRRKRIAKEICIHQYSNLGCQVFKVWIKFGFSEKATKFEKNLRRTFDKSVVFCARNSVLVKKLTKIFQNKCGQVVRIIQSLDNLYLLHFVAFFHVASLFSAGVDNEKALELTKSTVFHRGRQ